MELRHEAARGWTALTRDVAEQVAAMTSPASPHRKGSLESQEQSLGAQRRLRGALCPVTRWTHRRTLRRDMPPPGSPREPPQDGTRALSCGNPGLWLSPIYLCP